MSFKYEEDSNANVDHVRPQCNLKYTMIKVSKRTFVTSSIVPCNGLLHEKKPLSPTIKCQRPNMHHCDI